MIAEPLTSDRFQGNRWKAVRFGLRLANSFLGLGAMTGLYLLWCVIGLILCFVLAAFAFAGKFDTFTAALNPFALYGYVLPMVVIAAATWVQKFGSRLLWCAIPGSLSATILALAAVAGRVAVLAAGLSLALSSEPLAKGLLEPQRVACAGVAWLGLVAEWGFLRILNRDLVLAAGLSR